MMDKEMSGFLIAGIWPIDPNKFSENDFSLIDHTEVSDMHVVMDLETDVTNDDRALDQSRCDETLQRTPPRNTEPQPGPSGYDDTIQRTPPRNTERQTGPSRCDKTMHKTPSYNAKLKSNQQTAPQPGTSGNIKTQSSIPIEKLAPLPSKFIKKSSKSRAKQQSEIFTSTLLKTQLEIKLEKRNIKKKLKRPKKMKPRKKRQER
ncbi:uncharacterized protein [Diabrotica undecimpunctata]|uniref:uncharacterized protein n=1 Tax=Diabrotica undecimpunctata TaxID=50387 RepID=UPI003B63A40F